MIKVSPCHRLKPAQVSFTKVTAVIPCYNTQQAIASVVSKASKYVDEVIVVDDGSQDATREAAAAAGARVISHQKNLGKGAAMKTAVQATDADIIVFIDGDGQHDPDDVPELIKPILQGKADYVIGSRYLKESKVSSSPLTRKVANALASLIISFIISFIQPLARMINPRLLPGKALDRKPLPYKSLNKIKLRSATANYRLLNRSFKWISDCTSGFTAVRKSVWSQLDLISNRFQIETEVIFEQSKNGFIIAETPISCTWGEQGSKLSIIKDSFSTLLLLGGKLTLYSKSKADTEAS